MKSRDKGFSLIEVLVASFILFLVVGTVTLTFTGSVKSTLSATESLHLYGYTPLLAEHISFLVRSGETEGSQRFLSVDYDWKAELIASKQLASNYDSVAMEFQQSDRSAFLWKVNLTTQYNDRSLAHEFSVVSW